MFDPDHPTVHDPKETTTPVAPTLSKSGDTPFHVKILNTSNKLERYNVPKELQLLQVFDDVIEAEEATDAQIKAFAKIFFKLGPPIKDDKHIPIKYTINYYNLALRYKSAIKNLYLKK